ncbi:hypothetical protein RRG08_000831, partial [Elysia crispata]
MLHTCYMKLKYNNQDAINSLHRVRILFNADAGPCLTLNNTPGPAKIRALDLLVYQMTTAPDRSLQKVQNEK